jgi:hypothetical protein
MGRGDMRIRSVGCAVVSVKEAGPQTGPTPSERGENSGISPTPIQRRQFKNRLTPGRRGKRALRETAMLARVVMPTIAIRQGDVSGFTMLPVSG